MNHPKVSKVLLIGINAKYIHSNPAVYSLKAYADKYYPDRPAGCSLEIAEYTINQPTAPYLPTSISRDHSWQPFRAISGTGQLSRSCWQSFQSFCRIPRSGSAVRRFLFMPTG